VDNRKIRKLTTLALLTALVILFQAYLASLLTFWQLSLSLVLVPIVVGACLFGPAAGAWLGFVFGMTVLLSGQAAMFLGLNAPGTIVMVLLKGIAAGLVPGLLYDGLCEKNQKSAVLAAAAAAPVLNTGLFVIGCLTLYGDNVKALLTIFVLVNFAIELALNLVLNPTILFLVKAWKKTR